MQCNYITDPFYFFHLSTLTSPFLVFFFLHLPAPSTPTPSLSRSRRSTEPIKSSFGVMLVSSIINWTKPIRLLSGPSSQHSLHHTNMERGGNAWVTECPQWLRETESREGGGDGGGAWTGRETPTGGGGGLTNRCSISIYLSQCRMKNFK